MVNKLILFGLFCTLLQATGAKGADPDFDDTPLNIYVDSGKEIDSFINLTKKIDSKQHLMEAALEKLSAEVKAMAERMSAEAKATEERCNQRLSVKVTRLNQKVNELSEQLAKSQDVATPQKRPAERACEKIKNDIRSAGLTDTDGSRYYNFYFYKTAHEISKKCMGALIDKRFLLTLADCLPKHNIEKINVSFATEPKGIKKIHIHANYSKSTTRSDIALIELDSDLDYNTDLYPVCLYTSQLNPKNLIHEYTKAQTVPNAECEKNYNMNLQRFEACAKDLPNSFTLDGEPIYVEEKEFPKYQLFGIILLKAADYKPYYIAKVFDHLEFIENIVWPNYRI